MNAKLIDGKRIADDIIENCARRIDPLKSAGKTPGLAVIMVGENPASQVYVRNKVRAAKKPASIRKCIICRLIPMKKRC